MVSFELSPEQAFETVSGSAFRRYLFVINNGKKTILTTVSRFMNPRRQIEFDYKAAKKVLFSYLASNGAYWIHELPNASHHLGPYELLEHMKENGDLFSDNLPGDFDVIDRGDGSISTYGYVKSVKSTFCYSFSSLETFNAWSKEAKLLDRNACFDVKVLD